VTRVVLTISTALLLLCLAAPAQARPKPLIGIGEQNPNMFVDARWRTLEHPDVRYLIAWDALRYKDQRAAADWYLTWARDAGARVLLSFGHSYRRGRELRLPTGVSVSLIVRDETSFTPDRRTVLERGDDLLVVTPRGMREQTEARIQLLSRNGRLGRWTRDA